MKTVTVEQLRELAASAQKEPVNKVIYDLVKGSLTAEKIIHEQQLSVHKTKLLSNGTLYEIACPFNKDHKNDASITQFDDGGIGFQCFHNGCQSNTTRDFIELFYPGYYDKHKDSLTQKKLQVITLQELLIKEIPPRETMLAPWLLTQSLNMAYAWRGTGKTHLALGIGYTVASGGKFLKWEAEKPRPVLYLDGEMPAVSLQERLSRIVCSSEKKPPEDGFFRILTPDFQHKGIPDLGTAQGQELINQLITDTTELIIVDNLSAFVRTGKENDSEGWILMQEWALQQRAAGRSVLFIHHSGKDGKQRGTSKKEDLLDCVLSLKRPSDYNPQDGARFEIHFEKGRELYGDQADPFEAKLVTDELDKQTWSVERLSEATYSRVIDLAKQGLSQNEIAQELQINKSNVSRHMKRARQSGHFSKEKE